MFREDGLFPLARRQTSKVGLENSKNVTYVTFLNVCSSLNHSIKLSNHSWGLFEQQKHRFDEFYFVS